MKGTPTDFWGKLETDAVGAVIAWHPLIDHCADVAACCEALLTHTLLGDRLARLGGREHLSATDVARLSVLAALHDVGKFNSGFQRKGFPESSVQAGHVHEVLALLEPGIVYEETRLLLSSLPTNELCEWGPDERVALLLMAAIGHHGRPIATSSARYQAVYWKEYLGRDPFAGIRRLTDRLAAWFPVAFAEDGRNLPVNAEFQHAFAGLVMLADWIGSDTRFFPYSSGPEDRIEFARQQSLIALRESWIESSHARTGLGPSRPEFGLISSYAPRRIQKASLDLCASKGPSLVLIEAETGSGKTEAALARFLRLFHAGEVDGLYFALPTRTAATQIHRRLRDAVERAFPDESTRPPVILAVPGYLKFDDSSGKALPNFEVLWDDDRESRFRFRGWAAEHPKRYFAGTIVVGTIDQALLSSLMVSHAHMRATCLLRHLLVVDEVHASDAYMSLLTERVLENHLAAGGHAFLMSATLGSSARHRFFPEQGNPRGPGSLATEEAVPFPLLTVRTGSEVARIPIESESPEKRVAVNLRSWLDEPTSIAAAALDAAAAGAKVLVLRNTVTGCLAVQLAVEGRAVDAGCSELLFRCRSLPAPHHSRFAREDRELLDAELERRAGIAAPEGGCIVVATQTVQQSLDLDFDVLITDLCPMDVLLQRVGRVHRHVRPRARGFETAALTVLIPEARDFTSRISTRDGSASGNHGIGSVYDDLRILEATWRCLEKFPELKLPAMNRMLVERSTHAEILSTVSSEGGASWSQHSIRVLGRETAERQLARMNAINRSQDYDDERLGFPDNDLAREIRTRLGENDRIVRLDTTPRSPFGSEIRELTLPAHLCRGVAADADAAIVEQAPEGFVFRFGSRRYRYDRLGLRPEEEEEKS